MANIKRISRIKDFGIFKDFTCDTTTPDLKKLNIIYGWNYSGKTTISRLLNCVERNSVHDDYKSCEFELISEDGSKLTEKNISTSDKIVRVFNSDFVRDNLKWDGEEFEPILLLGEESIEAKKEIEKKTKINGRLRTIGIHLRSVISRLEKSIEEGLTRKASYIKSQLGLVEAFTKIHLRPILEQVKQQHKTYQLTTKEVSGFLDLARAKKDDKLDDLQEFSPLDNLSAISKNVNSLIQHVPQLSNTIDYFVKNPIVAKWVESGMQLHADKSNCEYCGNEISQPRSEELLSHFSEDLKNQTSSLEILISQIDDSILEAPKHTKNELYSQLRAEFVKENTKLKNSVSSYNKELKKLKKKLQSKIEKPFAVIAPYEYSTEVSSSLATSVKAYNKIILTQNNITKEFDKKKKDAIKKLKQHYASKLIDELDLFRKIEKISLYEKRLIKLAKIIESLSKEISELEATMSNAQKGRAKINDYIRNFLGRDEVNVTVEKKGNEEIFVLKRGSENAVNLSEGEKTAIAFSFFLTKLHEIEELEKAIVYIDDPISSFDSNHVFQVNALLKTFFFHKKDENSSIELNCAQLLISTHNFEFFTLLRELKFNPKDKEFFYVRRIDATTATFEELPRALKRYSSEYHYLFSEIYKFHNSENKSDYEALMSIPNAVRRFVELYTYSRIPSDYQSTVDNRADKLFGKERSKRILKVLHYFSHANDITRIMVNSDLICDIGNAVSDLLDEIKKDTLHYEELEKSVSA